jgi:hypothetical protein
LFFLFVFFFASRTLHQRLQKERNKLGNQKIRIEVEALNLFFFGKNMWGGWLLAA